MRTHTVLLAMALVVAGCGGSAPKAVPSSAALASPASSASGVAVSSRGASPAPTSTDGPGPTIEPTPAAPKPTAGPGPRPDFEDGECVWTVTDDLRVRSRPGVGPDSRRYEPLLPEGTGLCVIDGPVAESGYWWYEVELEPGQLHGGITAGWIAAGDHDGSAWIATGYEGDTGPIDEEYDEDPGEGYELPEPILEYVAAELDEDADGSVFVRYRLSVANWQDFDGLLWDESSDAGPCGEDASSVFVRIIDEDGNQLNGFCRFSSPDDLTTLWFAGPYAEAPPVIWLEIWDLESDAQAYSSAMLLENPYANFESPNP